VFGGRKETSPTYFSFFTRGETGNGAIHKTWPSVIKEKIQKKTRTAKGQLRDGHHLGDLRYLCCATLIN